MLNGQNYQSLPFGEAYNKKKIKQTIGFTWSPDERVFSQGAIYAFLRELCNNCAYYWYFPEYRNNHLKHGLHYHGVIIIYDKVKWFKVKGRFKAFVMQPKYVFDVDQKWCNYCAKDFCQNYTLYTNIDEGCYFHNVDQCSHTITS